MNRYDTFVINLSNIFSCLSVVYNLNLPSGCSCRGPKLEPCRILPNTAVVCVPFLPFIQVRLLSATGKSDNTVYFW